MKQKKQADKSNKMKYFCAYLFFYYNYNKIK